MDLIEYFPKFSVVKNTSNRFCFRQLLGVKVFQFKQDEPVGSVNPQDAKHNVKFVSALLIAFYFCLNMIN